MENQNKFVLNFPNAIDNCHDPLHGLENIYQFLF